MADRTERERLVEEVAKLVDAYHVSQARRGETIPGWDTLDEEERDGAREAARKILAAADLLSEEREPDTRTRYVVGFAFATDGSVLLTRKTHPEWQAGKLNGVGGHVEDGESYEEAMGREFEEEFGRRSANPWDHFATVEGEGFVLACFRTWDDDAVRDHPEENDVGEPFERVAVVSVVEGRECTIPNLRYLLPMASLYVSHDWPLSLRESYPGPVQEAPGE